MNGTEIVVVLYVCVCKDFIQIMALANRGRNQKLPPEVNRILYVKNLPYKITSEEMYDIFGKFGAVRQIRV
uniref:Bm11422 n=1 Tax=Brugia malayi TaxID=6279 RepID=A0A1I9GDK3_BRUMA|nr:Bm11422 [Brugia malayi]